MKKRKHVVAYFVGSDNVSQYLSNALTYYLALLAQGTTYVTFGAGVIAAAQTRAEAAQVAESKVPLGGLGAADARDLIVAPVITDVQNFVLLVQAASNNATTVAAATAAVTGCGLVTRKPVVTTKDSYTVTNDTTPGMVDVVFKAASKGVRACYQTAESLDNVTFTIVKTLPDSRHSFAHGHPKDTKVYYKGRVILSAKNGEEQAWITPPTLYIIVK
jgi:hypothetical protein